jgi:ABC-type uncharacterized transport system substrate-binding protein
MEAAYCPQQLAGLSLFGFNFRFLFARSRRKKMIGTRIAIVILHHENAWERRAVKGIIASVLNAFLPEEAPLFDIFSAEHSLQRIEEDIMPAIAAREKEYIAVMTCGSWVSEQVQIQLKTRAMKLTQLFLGVQHPVRNGLIKSFEIPEEGIVGVNTSPLNYEYCVESLKVLLPTVRTVLIPHDKVFGGEGYEFDVQRLASALNKHGIEARFISITVQEDIVTQLAPHLAGVDVLWSLYDPGLQINAKKVAKLCAELSVVFCANDLASVFQGADVGWGDSGSLSGAYAGQLCYALALGVSPLHIKNVEAVVSASVMRTNPSFFQKLPMDERVRTLIENIIPLGWE